MDPTLLASARQDQHLLQAKIDPTFARLRLEPESAAQPGRGLSLAQAAI